MTHTCNCEEMTCTEDCTKPHTHKTFACELCKVERGLGLSFSEEQTQSYKDRAITHVRSICPELMELSFGCEVYIKNEQAKGVYSGYYYEGKHRHKGRINVTHIDTGHLPYDSDQMKIIGHTPHLEHWLRGIESVTSDYSVSSLGMIEKWEKYEDKADVFKLTSHPLKRYNLTKDGENQSEEFYKAYCEIVGV